MPFTATSVAVLAWLQAVARWLFGGSGRSTPRVAAVPGAAYKGSRPNPPSAVAVVWAEDGVTHSATKQLADIIKWCDHGNLETFCVYDPSGDLKPKSSELQHELRNQNWNVQVGWQAEPIGQELTCEACRTQQQQMAGGAAPNAAPPSTPSAAAAPAPRERPNPAASRELQPPSAMPSVGPAAALPRPCKAADPVAPAPQPHPVSLAAAAAGAPHCGGPAPGRAPAGCSAVGCDAPLHVCPPPPSALAEGSAAASAAVAAAAAAASGCGCRQPLQSVPCTHHAGGGGGGGSLCRPTPPPLTAAATGSGPPPGSAAAGGGGGGGADGGEPLSPGRAAAKRQLQSQLPSQQPAADAETVTDAEADAGSAVAGAAAGACDDALTDCRRPCECCLAPDAAGVSTAAGTGAVWAAAAAAGSAAATATAAAAPGCCGRQDQAQLLQTRRESCACCRSSGSPPARRGPEGPSPTSCGGGTVADRGTDTQRQQTAPATVAATAAAAADACGARPGGGTEARCGRRVHVLSAEDGYAPVLRASATGGVCARCGAVVQLKSGPYREGLARLLDQMAQLAGPAVLVQPELVLVVGPLLTLAGFPPLQVAASEILHLGPASGLSRARVDAALAKFLRTEQRFGS
ncbi:hypothetical protein PLESTB_000368300 [Pleodorina starrii]|uniref:ditrans,polycis-polyprenyl diphosphate synthase [(2E,6E)-farnesyldiphosphate specific] n=1 Tax=Pleodorina starrii TaxID=330485 RepID=A0A9W6EZ81_9CHLO|nr:hypothetical protein PLESTM_000026600 [Pleodorina starrii]GLC50339.1 hypothetical protein PLESTB_000368300 [Pleodorina starrii]GLC64278.1 hypothetical protein PLESTF_000144400 [Pleodorina starrii]